MRKRSRLTFNEAVNGGLDAAKFYGMKGTDVEKSFRHHLDGMSTEGQRKFYKTFYHEHRSEKK
jgi:hypothetical protein